jgi:hypothetical protein
VPVRFNDAIEEALDGLYAARNALNDNKRAHEEFGPRVDALIDDLEREWAANGGPPVK